VVLILRARRRHTFFPARCRNRSQIRDGLRRFGACVQLCWRVNAVSRDTTKGWLLRYRAAIGKSFFIDWTYDRQVTGNLEKAYQTLELWFQTYPRGETPSVQSFLGGLATHGTGRFERAIEASQKEIAADPDFGLSYATLAQSYFLSPARRSPKRRARFSALRPSASWKCPIF